jgi:hypothetical protein
VSTQALEVRVGTTSPVSPAGSQQYQYQSIPSVSSHISPASSVPTASNTSSYSQSQQGQYQYPGYGQTSQYPLPEHSYPTQQPGYSHPPSYSQQSTYLQQSSVYGQSASAASQYGQQQHQMVQPTQAWYQGAPAHAGSVSDGQTASVSQSVAGYSSEYGGQRKDRDLGDDLDDDKNRKARNQDRYSGYRRESSRDSESL